MPAVSDEDFYTVKEIAHLGLCAPGVAQAAGIYSQLTNQADKRQVSGAEIGLTQNLGGSAATGVVKIYRHRD